MTIYHRKTFKQVLSYIQKNQKWHNPALAVYIIKDTTPISKFLANTCKANKSYDYFIQ